MKNGNELLVGTVDIQCRYPTIEAFTKATCEAGLSFEKAGLWETKLLHVPEEFIPSLPEPESDPVDVEVEYVTGPTIGIGEKTDVKIRLQNNSEKEIKGHIEISGQKLYSFPLLEQI